MLVEAICELILNEFGIGIHNPLSLDTSMDNYLIRRWVGASASSPSSYADHVHAPFTAPLSLKLLH
jgi:hypothetical protein